MKVRKLIDEADKAQAAELHQAIDQLQSQLEQLRKDVAEVLTRLRQQIEQLRIEVEMLKRNRDN